MLAAAPAWSAFELAPDALERWRRELLGPSDPRIYSSDRHTDARMHLGGIGTGNFEIGSDGQLTTWQLFNTLRDGHVPFHFLVKTGSVTKLLQTAGGPDWPRVKRIEMTGEYPLAHLQFQDEALPVQLELTAFSPFAPLDSDFSSMPVAVFIFKIHNPTKASQTVSLAALMQNPIGYDASGPNDGSANPSFGGNVNELLHEGKAEGLFMRAEVSSGAGTASSPRSVEQAGKPGKEPAIAPERRPGFGTLALAATAGKITISPATEHRAEVWQRFQADGKFSAPNQGRPNPPAPSGHTVYGAVASTVAIPAGGSVEVPFFLTWHYPNKHNAKNEWMGCHYATRWTDARVVMREAVSGFSDLHKRTERFRATVYDSTLPYWLLDCLTANAAIARHIGVVFRIANGDVYGWEGSNGCCQPTCTHVWGYEQTLSRLFPDLERDMRRIDFKHQQREDGGINNRTDVPSPPHPTGEHPFADGHASCILKAYREALNCPDDSLLKEYWPHIKRGLGYLIARDAKGAVQPSAGPQEAPHPPAGPAGFLQDDQWNTYDEALHGVTTFISGYYMAALRAGEDWAKRLGDSEAADRFRIVFDKGQKKLIELCWNGEYFQQHLPDYMKRQGEVGPGCMADQLIGQWWAHQLGLGYILPKEKVVSSLRSIFKYNFKSDLTGWHHAPRAFAGAKDKGLIICTWPKGGRPEKVMLYSDEVWTGIEYQVAAHMIYEGLIEEAFAIIKAARDRYDGVARAPIQRNPWNEIECGGHYARAMSSWSLLLALSGWEYDGPRQTLRIAPRHTPENFKSFFVGPEGWGKVVQARNLGSQRNEIHLNEGKLVLSQLILSATAKPREVKARRARKLVESAFSFESGSVTLRFKEPVIVQAGRMLAIEMAV